MLSKAFSSANRVWLLIAGAVLVVVIIASSIMGLFSFGSSDKSIAKASAPESKAAAKSVKKSTKPRWSELTAAQQEALAPLAHEWDHINPARKKKWLEIGNKVAMMTPDEKLRVQERIRDWVKLSPEQRRVARSNYAQTKKLDPNEKFAQWQRYQQLTEEQKKELAAVNGPVRKQVANPPTTSEKSTKIARSVKSTPKRELEKSLQSPAAQPAAPAAPAPAAPLVPEAAPA